MQVVYVCCAGLDVHKTVSVCISRCEADGQKRQRSCGSTGPLSGIYWR
jgi:hypothetical protein